MFVILLNMKKQLNIKIPENVSVNISPNNIEIKGKLGQLSLNKKEQFNCELDIQKNILVCSFIKDTYLIKKQMLTAKTSIKAYPKYSQFQVICY